MFPEHAFGDRCLEGRCASRLLLPCTHPLTCPTPPDLNLKILRDDSSCPGACQVIRWVKGCFDALDKKYVRVCVVRTYRYLLLLCGPALYSFCPLPSPPHPPPLSSSPSSLPPSLPPVCPWTAPEHSDWGECTCSEHCCSDFTNIPPVPSRSTAMCPTQRWVGCTCPSGRVHSANATSLSIRLSVCLSMQTVIESYTFKFSYGDGAGVDIYRSVV